MFLEQRMPCRSGLLLRRQRQASWSAQVAEDEPKPGEISKEDFTEERAAK